MSTHQIKQIPPPGLAAAAARNSVPESSHVYGRDPAFKLQTLPGSFLAYKKPDSIPYRIAKKEEQIQTAEGQVSAFPGDAIMTRVSDGKQWPIRRSSFTATYKLDSGGKTAHKIRKDIYVLVMPHTFSVEQNWGNHDVIRGETGDVLAEYVPGEDYGVVQMSEFAKTYTVVTLHEK